MFWKFFWRVSLSTDFIQSQKIKVFGEFFSKSGNFYFCSALVFFQNFKIGQMRQSNPTCRLPKAYYKIEEALFAPRVSSSTFTLLQLKKSSYAKCLEYYLHSQRNESNIHQKKQGANKLIIKMEFLRQSYQAKVDRLNN